MKEKGRPFTIITHVHYMPGKQGTAYEYNCTVYQNEGQGN